MAQKLLDDRGIERDGPSVVLSFGDAPHYLGSFVEGLRADVSRARVGLP